MIDTEPLAREWMKRHLLFARSHEPERMLKSLTALLDRVKEAALQAERAKAEKLVEALERCERILQHCIRIELSPAAWEPEPPDDPLFEGPIWESEGELHPLVARIRAVLEELKGEETLPA